MWYHNNCNIICISINLDIVTFMCNVNYSTGNFNKALKTVWWQLSPILTWYRGSPFTHMVYIWLGRNTYVHIMFIFGMKLFIYAITRTVDSFMQDLITPPCPRVDALLTRPSWNLWRGWVITVLNFYVYVLLIHALIPILLVSEKTPHTNAITSGVLCKSNRFPVSDRHCLWWHILGSIWWV